MPWVSNRLLSSGFSGTVVWQIHFITGAPSATAPARFAGAEYNSQPVPRQWVLVRASDGAVLASGQDSPTITLWVSVVNPIYGPTLEANTAYVLCVKNQNGDGGEMFMDLVL